MKKIDTIINKLFEQNDVLNKFIKVYFLNTGCNDATVYDINKLQNRLSTGGYVIETHDCISEVYDDFNSKENFYSYAVIFDLNKEIVSLIDNDLEHSYIFESLLTEDIEQYLSHANYRKLGLINKSKFEDNIWGAKDLVSHWNCPMCNKEIEHLKVNTKVTCVNCNTDFYRNK